MPGKKIPLAVVVGPTASGKTRLAIELCRRLNGEVISGDSMQLYKRLSIATAKPTPEEQTQAVHHLVDILEPWESFSVAQYTQLAGECITRLRSCGKLPVVAGGTGLYIRSLVDNITFEPQERDEQYRQKLRELAAEQGNHALHRLLEEVDPTAASGIHPNNLGRVIRALEVYHNTGITITAKQQRSREQPSPYKACIIGIDYRDRQTLYDRIDRRVDQMMEQGLLEEARYALGIELSPTAAQAIGYKEFRGYFAGTETLEQALELLKRQSRRYAKRQLTWFRREKDINWLFAEDYYSTDELGAAAAQITENTLAGLL